MRLHVFLDPFDLVPTFFLIFEKEIYYQIACDNKPRVTPLRHAQTLITEYHMLFFCINLFKCFIE